VAYEIHMLSGPETTKDEFEFLSKINNTNQDDKKIMEAKCCMNDTVFDIMKKGAFRLVYIDDDRHKLFWALIE